MLQGREAAASAASVQSASQQGRVRSLAIANSNGERKAIGEKDALIQSEQARTGTGWEGGRCRTTGD